MSRTNEELNNLYKASQDSLVFYKNKKGEIVSRITPIITENPKTFLELQSKDKEIKELQSLVKEYKKKLGSQGSATKIVSETNFNTSIPAKTVVDTIYREPTYTGDINLNEWVKGKIIASKDSILLQGFKITNKYSIVIGEESQGWFRPKKDFVDVISENPYTEIKSVRTYNVKDNRKDTSFSIGPYIGFGLGEDLRISPTIGIGLQYSLIKF